MNKRRTSKAISIGGVTVGGDAPIVVQSMTKTKTADVAATVAQINELADYDCELVRVAVPDAEAAAALPAIKKGISIPLIADIHFNYRLALTALEAGVDGLRLNPGNIGEPERVKKVALAAKDRGVPIRIGVNAGSLPKDLNPRYSVARRMVEAALRQIRLLESLDFDLIKVSLKTCPPPLTPTAGLPGWWTTHCTSASPRPAPHGPVLSAAPSASATCSIWASVTP
jgi:(E)-4-hydroxy-3-methylbut-2-enyl-diphosphate synthase